MVSECSLHGHAGAHAVHVVLHGLGDLLVTRAVVQKSALELFVLECLATLDEDLVLGLALLHHHVSHHFHLSFLRGGLLHVDLARHGLHLLDLHLLRLF